jgi:hypothetical protein
MFLSRVFNLFAFCIIINFSSIFPQNVSVQWGEIPIEDLTMTSYPADTNASALILYDFGETTVNNDLDLEFFNHTRVKILTQNGYDFGTHSIVIRSDKGTERIEGLEAVTYNYNSSGGIDKYPLSKNDIFKEKVDDSRTRYRFTLPNLQPGSVIEYKYKIVSQNLGMTRDWIFQTTEPVRWSEFVLRAPKAISFATVATGFESWAVMGNEEVPQHFSGRAASYLGKNIAYCNQYRYAVKDAPAMRDEPYVTTIDDYCNKVQVQLAGYAFATGGKQEILTSWKKLIDDLLDYKYFYDRLDVTGRIRDISKEVTSESATPLQKLKAIYDWVTKSIVWTKENRVYCSGDSDDVLKYKKGNNSDITFLLLSLLKSVGIEGDPVLLSTRANGKIVEAYPIISQFNYVLARVNIDGEYHFIDATDPYRPYDLLPLKVLNVRGLVIKEGPIEWVTVSSEKVIHEKSLTSLNINEDGSVNANIEVQYSDYKSLSIRQNLENKTDLDLIKELLDVEVLGFTVDSFTVSGKDDVNKPIRLSVSLTSSTYAQAGGDMVYLNPYILKTVQENPFKTRKRKFPIDYSYLSTKTIVCLIKLPGNYELKENVNSKKTNIGKSVLYSKTAGMNADQIQLLSKLEINEQTIKQQFYEQLRAVYNQIINAESELLVIGLKNIDAGQGTN